MASLTHTQTRLLYGDLYRVVDTVTATVSMPTQVFVFLTATPGVYNRVASVNDLNTLPDTLVQAQTDGAEYYRLATVTRDFTVLAQAETFATEVIGRLKLLVVEYDSATTQFIGTTTETLSS